MMLTFYVIRKFPILLKSIVFLIKHVAFIFVVPVGHVSLNTDVRSLDICVHIYIVFCAAMIISEMMEVAKFVLHPAGEHVSMYLTLSRFRLLCCRSRTLYGTHWYGFYRWT